MIRLAVFASGTGTNFVAIQEAILNHKVDGEIVQVVVDKKNAPVIEKAQGYNIPVFSFSAKDYPDKLAYEKEIVNLMKDKKVDLIILAGYMRILSDYFIGEYENRIINIHPSLLPAFKGKDAIGQAYEYGVKVMGVSIHYVSGELDGGKIIAQKAFDVKEDDTHEIVEAHIHEIEHQLYPATIQQLIKKMEEGHE